MTRGVLGRGGIRKIIGGAGKYAGTCFSSISGRQVCGPILATFFLTYRCNHLCRMCGFPDRVSGKSELSTGEVIKLLTEFADSGVMGVGFTGGEPLIRKDLFDILEASVALGLHTHLNTNGTKISEETAARLVSTGLDSINISLDSPRVDEHDGIRGGKGFFESTLAGLRRLLDAAGESGKSSPVINLVMVVGDYNHDSAIGMVDLAEDTGVDGLGFMPCHTFSSNGNEKHSIKMVRSKHNNSKLSEILKTVDMLLDEKKKRGILDNSETYIKLFRNFFQGESLPFRCYAGFQSVVVDPYGDYYPCIPWCEMGLKVAEKKDGNFHEIWFGDTYRDIRKKMLQCRECFWNCHTELNLLFHPLFVLRKMFQS